ncbi:MAG: DUF2066 domain-containing protein [Alphaproteobacteria bacterium]|nr:DUF2066 domain-containing protein [Alphaproteobacteria bacterium]
MRKLLGNKSLFQLIMVFSVIWCAPSFAQVTETEDPLDRLFTIKAVEVDETAARASVARETALAKAELQAYAVLLRKLTQPEARERLPMLSRQEIQAMISGIEVVREQSSSRRYLATLNIRFEPGLVSQFLAQYKVPHVLGTGRGVLVLHAHKRSFAGILWEKDPTLDASRADVDWLNRIRQYVFPVGTVEERAAVTFEEVASFDSQDALAMARSYGVSSVLLLRSVWHNGRLTYSYFASDEKISSPSDSLVADSEDAAITQMYDVVLDRIDSAWRAQLLVDTGVGGALDVLVPTSKLTDYNLVISRLADVSLIGERETLEIGLPFSQIRFRYAGREDQLRLALRYAGLSLEKYGEKTVLALRSPENNN